MRYTLFVLLALSAIQPKAQPSRDELCEQAYHELVAESLVIEARAPVENCSFFAFVLEDEVANDLLRTSAEEAMTARDVQPQRGASGGAGGSVAQAEAVSSLGIEPFAGGSVSAVGTEDGAGTIATLSLNPLILSGSLSDVGGVAGKTRLFDLSLLVPVDDADRNRDGRIDYFGFRARVNLTAIGVGKQVYEDLLADYRAIFGEMLDAAEITYALIDSLLSNTSDIEVCARAILSNISVAPEACGVTYGVTLSDDLYDHLDAAAARVRAAADKSYFGLDFRFDYGDPTLGRTPGAYGTALTGLVAFGRDLGGGSLNGALRGYLGLYFADRDSMDTARIAFDGAIGFAFTRGYELQQISLQAGLSFRFDLNDPGTTLDTEENTLALNGSLNIPITASNSASLKFGLPLLGKTGPVLSLTGNWHLPLPGR